MPRLPKQPHLSSAVAVLIALVLFVGACGGSETGSESAQIDEPTEPTEQPTEPPSPSPTSPPAPPATATSQPPTPEPPTPEPPTPEPPTPEPSADEAPTNFSERGPYAVGVVTRSLGDRDVEIWFPVDPETVEGQPTEVFDALSAFPENLQAIIPPELSGEYDTLAVRDAPALAEQFPILIYGHGFGGYRQIATHFTSHLASWGFVVASADHLERGIAEQTLDLVGGGLFDETNSRPDAAVDEVRNTIELLGELNAEGPFAGAMDLDRLAIGGHSAGAFAAIQAAAAEPDRIDGWISVSGGTRDALELTQPGLVLIGELDAVVPAERSYELYESVAVPQVLLNIQGAGHNSFTDPCRGITDLGGLSALTALLGEEQVARAEDGCTPGATEPEIAQAMVNQVSIAWLHELFGLAVTGQPLAAEVISDLGPVADYRTN